MYLGAPKRKKCNGQVIYVGDRTTDAQKTTTTTTPQATTTTTPLATTTTAPPATTTTTPATTAAPTVTTTTALPDTTTTAQPGTTITAQPATTTTSRPATTTTAQPVTTTTAQPATTITITYTDPPLLDMCFSASNPAENEVWLTTGGIDSFTSSNYPSNYGSADDKEWIFCAVNSADRIMITCSDFQVGGFFFGCTDDKLLITNTETSISEFCSTNGPQLVKTTSRGTKVTFTTSTSNIYKGFTCTAQAVRKTDCNSATDRASYEVWLANGISETFTSPNHPSNYGSGDSKRWVFCAVDSNDHIQISCSDFNVGGFFFDCTDDTFTISNIDSNSNSRFCSTNAPKFVDSTERDTVVTLSTGSAFGSPGFSCTATALKTLCQDPINRDPNEIWLINGQVESFSSPGYPSSNYGSGDSKEWRFCAVDSIDRIEVSCDSFQVGASFFGCLDDILTISNVDSESEFCGIAGPQAVKTSERGTSIKLDVSTGSIYDGFSCTTKAVRDVICMDPLKPAANEVWLASGSSSIFTSPNYPSNYGSGDSTNWIFCAIQDSEKISISCSDFTVGGKFIFCLDDMVTISNTDSGVGPFCGTDGPNSVVTTQRGTTVSLSVSPAFHYKGFSCTATAVNQ
ncbi:cubilin-like [Penaeus chinensis]|uniref:cubilin-like n=1 Tax=Penaeus chinensis TaxID=139456 RepID=UPI001FB64391|nr:cubilin-like [Penaeus chinensis]